MNTSENISDCQSIAFGNSENGRLWCFQNTDNQYRYSCKITPNSTGKELDAETGYSYFGARYLDHALTTAWLSMDPMADKYPSISPYAYCAWNPVKLVDPNGQDIDSSSVSEKIWNLVDSKHECYNAEFAEVFNQLANDHTTLFSFQEWELPEVKGIYIIKGRFSMIESKPNQIDKTVIAFWWDEGSCVIAPERYLFEEVYHAKQFLDGKFGFGRLFTDSEWSKMGLDLLDEKEAHDWADHVSGSISSWTPDAVDYYVKVKKIPVTRRNVTEHYMLYDGVKREKPPNYNADGVYKETFRTMRIPK